MNLSDFLARKAQLARPVGFGHTGNRPGDTEMQATNRINITITAQNGHVLYRANTFARKGINDCETVWTFLSDLNVRPAMGDRVRWERVA